MASFEELALNIYKHHHMALSIMAPYTSLSRRLMMSFCYAAQVCRPYLLQCSSLSNLVYLTLCPLLLAAAELGFQGLRVWGASRGMSAVFPQMAMPGLFEQ